MDIEKAIDCLKADKEYLTDMKICDGEEIDIAIRALEKQKTMGCLLEKAAEEIENIYGRETELSEEIRDLLDCLKYLFSAEELDKLFVNIVIEMLKRSADKCVVAC